MRLPLRSASCASLLCLLLAAGCADNPLQQSPTERQPRPAPLGVVEITLSGIGGSQMSALAAPVGGARYSLSSPSNSGGTGGDGIQMEQLSSGSFTEGSRGAGGYRYLWATFRIRNADRNGNAYDTQRQNLTFFAVPNGASLGGSAVSRLSRFDGTVADPAIAAGVLPTGLVARDGAGRIVPVSADILQVLTEAEAAAAGVLPYGFVARNAGDGSRRLPASPAVGQYDGVVTFAFRVPLQATSFEDPYTISLLFLAQDDSETRVTQSLEEQTPGGEAAFVARAAEIGATMRSVLPGSGLADDAARTRTLCTVRVAGTSEAPTAHLVNRTLSAVELTGSASTWPLWAGGSVGRPFRTTLRDGSGAPVSDVPVQWSYGTAEVLTQWPGSGLWRVRRRERGSSTVAVQACGLTSASFTVRTSPFISLTAGSGHALAVRADGTVAGWGDNDRGQINIPTSSTVNGGLVGVVQVAAGRDHSLALRDDGVVAAWGYNGYGEAGLGGYYDAVQIAAGSAHSLVLQRDGKVLSFGAWWSTPPAGLDSVVQIAAGSVASLALRSNGKVVFWGGNRYTQLVPAGLDSVVQIAVGRDHALALRADGTVVVWGDNYFGQLNMPAGLSDVVQVASGDYHSLALRSDGTVVAWGDNGNGQSTVPAGLTGVVQVAAGDRYSLALRSGGSIVGWGATYGPITPPAGLAAAVP